jgi:hypothetical protein
MGRSALRHTARRRPIVVDEPPPACLHSTINAKALTDLRDALWEGKADPEFKRRSELLLSMVQQAMRRGIAATSMRDLLNQLISSETKLVARGGVKLRYIDHVKLAAAKIIALEGPAVARGSGDDAPDTDDEPWFDSNDCVDVVRDAVRLFRRAVLRSPSKAPSLLNHGSTPRARMPSPCEAARLGSLGETVRALMAATRVSSRWSTTANGEFETTSVNARAHCLLQSSRIVVLDATPDLDALRVVRPDAHVVHLDVADGAPCTRTLLYWGKGARRFLVPSGAVDEALLADALVHTLRRLPVDCRNVLIVTHMPVADHLRNKRYRAPALQSVVREYERRGEFRIEHYGRIEGRNTFEGLSWSDLDAVVTIGDPWPNVDSVAREVRVLRLKTTPSERLQHLAEAELAQAHGRLRAPRRTRPGTMIHVGRVIPLGWHGGNTTVDGLSWGRPRGTSHMDAQELEGLASRAGGWRALARAARVSPRSLRKYRNGICSVSASIAAKLRSAVG